MNTRLHPRDPDPSEKPAAPGAPESAGSDDRPLREKVEAALKDVYDPEIPVSIYELGLIYKVNISEANHVGVVMTLTTPNCPEAQSLPASVEGTIRAIPEVSDASVEIVWDPPWDKEMMSDAAKLQLGMM